MVISKPPSKARQERIKKLEEKYAMEKALKNAQIRKATIQKLKDLQAKAIARRRKHLLPPKPRQQVKAPTPSNRPIPKRIPTRPTRTTKRPVRATRKRPVRTPIRRPVRAPNKRQLPSVIQRMRAQQRR